MTHEEIQQLAALDAIGAASAEELAELRRHLETCDECRRVAEEMHEAAALLALTTDPVTPPADARAKMLASLPPRAQASNFQWWMAAAAAVAIALLAWTSFQLRDAREEIEMLKADNAKLASVVASLTGSQTRTIQLAGQEVAPKASASVFLDPAQRRAFLFFHGLPANPNDKSYQLWIIRADQVKPVNAGVFNVDASGNASLIVQNFPVDTLIKALAVTLEPRGGLQAPTGQKYLVGSS
jgi:anti-sigma-K factor RskA